MLAIFYIYLDNVSHSNGIILVILSKAYVTFDLIVDVMPIIPFFFFLLTFVWQASINFC
jgi:photosystem II PsbK protein